MKRVGVFPIITSVWSALAAMEACLLLFGPRHTNVGLVMFMLCFYTAGSLLCIAATYTLAD